MTEREQVVDMLYDLLDALTGLPPHYRRILEAHIAAIVDALRPV